MVGDEGTPLLPAVLKRRQHSRVYALSAGVIVVGFGAQPSPLFAGALLAVGGGVFVLTKDWADATGYS